MATPVLSKSVSEPQNLIASPWHTLVVLLVQGALSFRAMTQAAVMHNAGNPDRMRLYGKTILFEWLVFVLMVVGLRLHGSSILTVVGDRWRSVSQILRHVGIAVLFLIGTIALTSILGGHAHQDGSQSSTQYLLPRSQAEVGIWVLLSITAGFCEEALYRGYFQRQFMALTKSVPAGIVLSAAAFGCAHAYQGLQQAVQIGFLGLMGGTLAYVCRSVRPGMIAHTLQDVLAAFVRRG